ncbi:HlyD family secretion protein [Fuscovulum blasticum]|uniref:HlyD family secretion protein n=1 Tax=Fuscovulum blasticum TaxID=1075 RepID=UPI000D3E6856|nr:HlyD family efflux transporter periplasmic adaptor subunit [Fuscovulum blasticum]AWD22240.1 HlyD family secretion protein [Fuscovulum blasticum]
MADFLCSLGFLSAFFTACAAPPPLATGYVEGDYVQAAPLVVVRVESLTVARGDRIEAAQVLARVEDQDARIAVASAKAALDKAESDLANLLEGSRAPEIAAVEAALASARANADRSAKEAERQEQLLRQKVSSQAQLDAARAASDMAAAAVSEAEAQLEVARLPARPHLIDAAAAAVEVARTTKALADWQLAQRSLTAVAPGVVTDILRRPGEVAGPSAPVLSYLPDGAIKLRLYVPEPDLARVAVGTRLDVTCDGCAATTATVTYVADQAEFTPPVIYSNDARQKLVYQVEARPDPGAPLKPGQIVEVQIAP